MEPHARAHTVLQREPSNAPRSRYEERLEARRAAFEHAERQDRRIASLRLFAFVALAVVVGLVLFGPRLSLAFTLPPLALFIALLGVHERVLRTRARALRAVRFFETGIERIEERWQGRGQDGSAFLEPQHPYAADLDLFGRGSLFERLCLAETEAGRRALAALLAGGASLEEARARQGAVRELKGRLSLREDLFVLGGEVALEGVRGASLAEWAGAAPRPPSPLVPLIGVLLSAAALAALAMWGFEITGPLPALAALTLEGLYALALRPRVSALLAAADAAGRELSLLARLLSRLERESFEDPHLAQLRASLDVDGRPASAQLARLTRLFELLDSRRNLFFAPLAAVLLWGTQLAFVLERWRAKVGSSIPVWLEAVGRIEALSSVASYAFERAEDPFPELTAEGPCFHAEAIAHPLLPESAAVPNDVTLDGARQLLVVSGSNMSGKSTLMRSVGINAVLALAGAPVRARKLTVSSLSIGATLRVQDSLAEGASRFYAEVTRIRQVMELARDRPPALFLLDEILAGTNSHDRARGAEAVVRGLLARGAIGLVTTHDLALSRLADELAPRARNVHFEDELKDGRLVFDYRLKDGVVTRSNAIELMRAVGLDV